MIGLKLKQVRERRKLSQEQLASLVDLPVSVIAQIENGEMPNPTCETAKRLARTLGVSIDYLVGTWEGRTPHREEQNALFGRSMIDVRHIPKKGRGLIAVQPIYAGTLIEVAPVASFPAEERAIVDKTSVFPYYFIQPSEYRQSKESRGHFVFGIVSLCNHADEPNACVKWVENEVGLWTHLMALKDIEPGEEVTMYYTNVDEYSFRNDD